MNQFVSENGEVLTGIPPMPPKVAAAVAAVMAEVPKLAKTERNTHGSYNFASIDDFLEAVRPLCAKSGLIIVQDEDGFEMRDGGSDKNGKPVSWLVIRFKFTLAHASGETWAHRPTRTIMVAASMGAQAFGAAQSYCLKQFERSLFQIATGEKGADADEHPAADLPSMTALTVEQQEELQQGIMDADIDLPKFLKFFGVAKLADLSADRLQDARAAIAAKAAKKAKAA